MNRENKNPETENKNSELEREYVVQIERDRI